MIEIITEPIAMPDLENRRYQYGVMSMNPRTKWTVIDTENNGAIRYKGKYEDAAIALHNLNKKHYKKAQT